MVAGSRVGRLGRTANLPGFGLLRIRCSDVGCRDTFERQPVGQALLQPAAEARRKRHAGVPQRQWVLLQRIRNHSPNNSGKLMIAADPALAGEANGSRLRPASEIL